MNGQNFLNILITAVLCYLAFVAYLYFAQRRMMYFPDVTRPDAAGIPGVEVITVHTDDNLDLQGWHFPAKPGRPLIVYFHGNASNIVNRLPKIAGYVNSGYGVLLAEYRGYGGNPGAPTEEGLYEDARAYMQWAQERSKAIVLYGESLGSGVAAQMAVEYAIQGLVLESAFTSFADVGRKAYFYLPIDLLLHDKYKSIDKIGKVKAPVLIIHGESDNIIPITYARRLYEAANEPKTFIPLPGAGHNDIQQYGLALHVLQFLSNITGSEGPKEE